MERLELWSGLCKYGCPGVAVIAFVDARIGGGTALEAASAAALMCVLACYLLPATRYLGPRWMNMCVRSAYALASDDLEREPDIPGICWSDWLAERSMAGTANPTIPFA
jgi:hypothetical protein